MAKSVIVPTPIFLKKENIQFILPLFLYMQIKQGRDGTVLTSLELLLSACGYVYNRQSKNLGYVDNVKSALDYLKMHGYINEFYDKHGIKILENISTERPTNIFIIEVNDAIMNYTGDGFGQMFVDDYRRILDFSKSNSKIRLNKMLYLYCFISRYMFRRHKNYIDDVRYEELNMKMARDEPNYYFTTYDRLSNSLGDGFSRSSVIKLLEALENCGVIHYRSIGNFIVNSYGETRAGGTIFVIDSNYWEIELEAAVQVEKNKRSKYYMKGEEATALD